MPDTRKDFALKLMADDPNISDADLEAALKVFDARQAPQAPPSPTMTGYQTLGDAAIGFGKGAVRSVAALAKMAAQSHMLPGLTPESLPPEVVDAYTPKYTNTAQQVGGGLETAVELAAPARAAFGLARAGAARAAPTVARMLASDTPLLIQARQIASRKILGRILEMATEKVPSANAGGRLVPGVGKKIDNVIADALEELRAPQLPTKVTAPPPVELPPGYTPRSTVPIEATPRPRLVTQAPAASTAPARPYFTKPDTPTQAPREVQAIGMNDLPMSWRSRVGDVGPTQNINNADMAKAFADELASRGVSAKEAILLVSKNPNLPPGVRLQLISALKAAGGIQ